jgi:hypothetical protein
MGTSDIIAFFSLIVSLFSIGLSRHYGIVDQRTRCIKDHYITELIGVHKEIVDFYSELFAGKLCGQDVVSWCKDHRSRWESLDTSMRKDLQLYFENIYLFLFSIHIKLTEMDEFNNLYKKKIQLTQSSLSDIRIWERESLNFIENCILDVNGAHSKNVFIRYTNQHRSAYTYAYSHNKWLLLYLGVCDIFHFGLLCLIVYFIISAYCYLTSTQVVDEQSNPIYKIYGI